MSRPPRLVQWVVGRLLPEEIAESVLGDLEEGWRHRVEAGGRLRAGLWYAGQVVRLRSGTLRRGVARLRRGPWRSVSAMVRGGGILNGEGVMGTRGWMIQEVRVAVRSLARRPAFSGVIVATLALSIGAATLVVSALEAVLMRPLPYPEAHRIVDLNTVNEAWRDGDNPQLREFADRYFLAMDQLEAVRSVPGLESVGGMATGGMVLEGATGPRRISVAFVSRGVFETLGVEPARGRLFTPEEHLDGAPVVVVSHGFWSSELGGDPEAVGRTVVLEGEPRTVIGVMPRGFYVPAPGQEVWAPLPAAFRGEQRTIQVLSAVGRLAPGAELEAVEEAADARVRQVAEADPGRAGFGIRATLRRDRVVERAQGGLSLLLGAAALVVVLAAVNLATLVLARATRRDGELAVRRALGGGPWAVGWSLVAEVGVLCVVGGALGVGLAMVALDPFAGALAAVDVLRVGEARVNGVVLLVAAGTTVLAALGAGIPVAWRAARRWPGGALSSGRRAGASRAGRRTLSGLLAVESGLAVVLLAGALLLVRSLGAVGAVDPGFEPRGLSFVELGVAGGTPPEEAVSSFEAVAAALEDRWGGAATLVDPLPLAGSGGISLLRGPADERPRQVPSTAVGPDFFEVAGIEVLRGRGIRADDDARAPAVVVVGAQLARELVPGGDALGAEVEVGTGADAVPAVVVGVVADARMMALPTEADGRVYIPLRQEPSGTAVALVRQGEDGLAGAGGESVREMARRVAPEVIVEGQGTVLGQAWEILAPLQVRTVLLAALAGLALLLAAVGIAGVAGFVVEDRRREIGIRMALGARAGVETRRVLRAFLTTVGVGTAAGLVVALVLSGLMEAFLHEVRPLDPWSYLAAALVLPVVGGIAAWIPARRAATVDPVEVLTGE